MWVFLNCNPQAIEEKISVQSVSQHIGMETLFQQHAIRPSRTQDRTHFIICEPGHRPARCQQLISVIKEQPIDSSKAGDDLGHGADSLDADARQ